MAVDVLSIPSMSAESERVFSGTRRQITPDRARLSGIAIAQAECLKSWIKNQIHPVEEPAIGRISSAEEDSEYEDVESSSDDDASL